MGNSYNNFIGWFTWYDIFSNTEILRGNRKGHALIILAIKSYMHRKIHDYYFSTNNKLYIMCELSHFCGVWLRLYGLYVACQAPLSMDFSRQEYWSGLPFLSPRSLPHPGIWPRIQTLFSCIVGGFFTIWATGKPRHCECFRKNGTEPWKACLCIMVTFPFQGMLKEKHTQGKE